MKRVSNSDCASGETCVAGASPNPIQACVKGAVCGGLSAGNCPSDSTSGQLACIPQNDVYKCVSIYRCDQYFGDAACSEGCNDDEGSVCSDQGFCSISLLSSGGSPTFGCTCNDGYSGDKCEAGATPSADSSTSDSGASLDTEDTESGKSTSQTNLNATSLSPSPEGTPEPDTNVVRESTDNRPESTQMDDKGTGSAVFVTVGILASCMFIGALVFAMYARKKRREGAQADGFGGETAFVAPAASTKSDIEGGSGDDTPKSTIVTM